MLCNELPVLGINCAHSGTVLGLLYGGAPGRDELLRERVQRCFGADLPVIGDFNVIGGGNHAV
jgi:L-threonine kinase